jgi:hypothetical protein
MILVLLVLAATACGPPEEQPRGLVTHWTLVDEQAGGESTTPQVSELEHPAGGHCSNWAGVVFLHVFKSREGNGFPIAQFIRDPQQRMSPHELAPFESGVSLTEDAIWTGWRDGERELWLAPDRSTAFVGSGDQWERWPAPPYPIGCS